MKPYRSLSRRSFLSIVGGGAAAGSLGLVSGSASGAAVQGCTDTDPISRGGDPGGRGRNCQNRPVTGCSDSDPSDPSGRGRSCQSRPVTGCSDRDPSDPSGSGRTCGGNQNPNVYQTGRRERRYEVCWVDHPSRSDNECNIQTYSEWQITYSDGHVEYDTTESMARRAEMERRGYSARWHRMVVNDW